MKGIHLKHIWLVLAAYGVWFAVLSGVEEVLIGKYWKVVLSLTLGILSFLFIEIKLKK